MRHASILLQSTLLCVGFWLFTPAIAQQAPVADATPTPSLEEVVVTGSRLATPNQASASPIMVVTKEEVQLQGTTDVIDLLNNLPQNFQNNVADISNTSNPLAGPGGITTADLRGLGPQRTLVLVDGHRLGIGDSNTANTNPAPDLDQIPVQLIERIDVVTGGESAIYGSDAIAGVVNFVMKHDFEGVQLDAQYGGDQHSNHNMGAQNAISAAAAQMAPANEPPGSVVDGSTKTFSVILGNNFDDHKGNITGYFNYRDAAPVSMSSRDFSACKIDVTAAGAIFCDGSPNSNYFQPPNAANPYSVVGNQLLVQGAPGTANSTPPALFNSNPYQYLARQDTRYSAGVFARYNASDALEVYSDFSFMNDRSSIIVGPSGLFGGSSNVPSGLFSVNCNNPLLSAQEVSVLCTPANITPGTNNVALLIGRRNIEGGGRVADWEHQNFREVLGARGEINSAWRYDVDAQYYYTSLYNSNADYINNANAGEALQVVNVNGVPTCTSVVAGFSSSCVPYNIWKTGGVTQAQEQYLETIGTSYGTVEEKTATANLIGDLGKYDIKLPTADDGIAVSLGAEYRSDHLVWTPDAISASGNLAGSSGVVTAVDAGYNVKEAYTEFRVPLVQKRTGVEDLALTAAYRYSDYSTSAGKVNTYNFGIQYSPIQDVRLRVSYARAIRAPNVIELFTPDAVTQSASVTSDPCSGAAPSATLAQCMHTGVTAAQYGHIVQCPAGQCGSLSGGNPDLAPEQANTLSFGVSIVPQDLPGFNASLDYYRIDLKNEIGSVPNVAYLDDCLTTGSSTYCNTIHRSALGYLFGASISGGGYVDATGLNIASVTLSGIDLNAGYRVPLGDNLGRLQVNLNGTFLDHIYETSFPGAPTSDCAGLYGPNCQTLNPRWRQTVRLSWVTPWNWLVSANWRYIGRMGLDTNTSQPALSNGAYDPFDATLPAVNYLDLTAVWEAGHGLTVRAGVNNVLDRDPPIVSSAVTGTGAPNTYPTYDLLGRVFFINGTLKF